MPVEDWLSWFARSGREAISYLPVAIPLALATVVGGIDCTESAAAAGDDYPTGQIIATEGLATIVGALFGGVIQSTPYIGHPAYKAMGGRAAYTLATALFVGAAGNLRIFRPDLLCHPEARDFPDLDLRRPGNHLAVVPCDFPSSLSGGCAGVRSRVGVPGGADVGSSPAGDGKAIRGLSVQTQHYIQTVTVIAGGGSFIVTSLLWATALAHLIDGHLRRVVATLLLASVFSWFGIIHSPLPSSPIMSPAAVIAQLEADGRAQAAAQQTPYHWSAAYALMAMAVLALGQFGTRPSHVPIETLTRLERRGHANDEPACSSSRLRARQEFCAGVVRYRRPD